MNLVLDIATSAEFWRRVYPANRAPKPAMPIFPTDCAHLKREISPMLPDWVDQGMLKKTGGALHVLSTDGTQAHRCGSLVVHAWSSPISEGSFYEVVPGVLVESPCFMFLRASSILDFPSLVAFGQELCGLFSFDERLERGFRKRKVPLITKERLEHYVMCSAGVPGYRAARCALDHVVEYSASPMETFDELTMCLPYYRGGYGLYKPAMNYRVDLTARAARIARRQKCYLDMGYPTKHLDVEHHGKFDHSSEDDIASDRARVNGLKEMKFEVIELTTSQVSDLLAYEYIIQRIAKILGKRLRKDKLGSLPEREQLRRSLFAWNSSSGKLC